MAEIVNGYLQVLMGDFVTRRVGVRNFIQTKVQKGRLKQSERSKAAGIDFGTASHAGVMIRTAFRKIHGDLYDAGMVNRLNKHVLRALRANRLQQAGAMRLRSGKLDRLINFQFNENCHLQDYMFVDLEQEMSAGKLLHLVLPGFKKYQGIQMIDRISHVAIQVGVFAFDFDNSNLSEVGSEEVFFTALPGGELVEAHQWTFDCSRFNDHIVLVGMSIQYMQYVNNRYQQTGPAD